MADKKKVLIIKTGGTIAQKIGPGGTMEPCHDDFLPEVKGLEDIADIEAIDLGNIDSTNMETNLGCTNPTEAEKKKDRTHIARAIYDNAFKYGGFVVAHGTDTMAETAAALTYMLSDFRKPIVLTGSQRSIWVPRSDAPNNVYTAVQAATMDLGEVVIAFGNYVLRGSRARKIDEEGYDAFSTPGMQPLGKLTSLSEGIRLADHRTKRSNFDPRIFTGFDTRVMHYQHISGATVDEDLLYLADSPNNHGIILGSFGAGNNPDRLLPFIHAAREKGKPVYVYTKCETGAADMGIYSVGAAPLEAGAKPAGDMTLEALGQKLMYAIGRANADNLTGDAKLSFVDSIIRTPYNFDITVTERRK